MEEIFERLNLQCTYKTAKMNFCVKNKINYQY